MTKYYSTHAPFEIVSRRRPKFGEVADRTEPVTSAFSRKNSSRFCDAAEKNCLFLRRKKAFEMLTFLQSFLVKNHFMPKRI
jgi:hypothetical protein